MVHDLYEGRGKCIDLSVGLIDRSIWRRFSQLHIHLQEYSTYNDPKPVANHHFINLILQSSFQPSKIHPYPYEVYSLLAATLTIPLSVPFLKSKTTSTLSNQTSPKIFTPPTIVFS